MRLEVLNTKQVKKISNMLDSQFGVKEKINYVFLQNPERRVFITNRETASFDSNLRVNNMGLYFGAIDGNEIRLTIEGSQIAGLHAKKNVVELNDKEAINWMKGLDIEKDLEGHGFVIIKNSTDFLGCGRYKNGKIINFVPKERRILKKEVFIE